MKKSSFVFSAFAVAVMFAGCSKEVIEDPQKPDVKTIVISAGLEDSYTKTTFGEKEEKSIPVYWQVGDKISVNGVESAALEEGDITSGGKSAKFTVTGEIGGTPYNVIHDESMYVDGSNIKLPYNASGVVPVYGQVSSIEEGCNLNSLCAMLNLQIKKGTEDATLRYVMLETTSTQVSGQFGFDYSTGKLTPKDSPEAGDRQVVVNVDKALSEEALDVYIPLPAGTYGFTVKLVDADNNCMAISTTSDKTFTAGSVKPLSAVTFNPTGKVDAIVISGETGWNEFVEDYSAGNVGIYSCVKLSSDIDCSSSTKAGNTEITTLENFSGTLDGDGHAFKSLNKMLIKNLGKYGVVKNVVIDENSSFTVVVGDANARYGFIANSNFGTITNCTVKGNIGFEIPNDSASAAGFFGGIAGRSFGDISGCTYSGTMSNTCATSESRQGYVYVGGITGDANTDEENSVSTGNVKDCTFSGKIQLGVNAGKVEDVSYDGITCANTTGVRIAGIAARIQNSNVVDNCSTTSDALIDVRGTQKVLYVGGISGTAQNTVQNCINNAKIKVIESGANVSGGNAVIGGIAGRAAGTIKSCINSADSLVAKNDNRSNFVGGIVGRADDTATIESSSNSSAVAQSKIAGRYPYVGGIAGYNESSSWSGTITNTGKISMEMINDKAQYSSGNLGGVIGGNKAAIDGSNTLSNSGEVYFSNTSIEGYNYVSVGGVVGYSSADVKNVKNTGKLTLYTSVAVKPVIENEYYKYTALGGIVGSTESAITISGCTNEIPYDEDNPGVRALLDAETKAYNTNWCEGGILGYTNAAITVSGCTNKSFVMHDADKASTLNRNSFTGGIVGKIDGAAAKIISCTHSSWADSHSYNNALTIDTAPYLGGIVGAIIGESAETKASISACTASIGSAKYTVYSYRGICGGIAGYAKYATIGGENDSDACTVSGKVLGNKNSSYNGGIVGWAENSTVQKCTCTAKLEVMKYQGGIVANLNTGSTITDCIFNGTMTKGTLTTGTSLPTDPKAIASCSVSGSTITNCGLAGTIADTAISGSNYSDYICNDKKATISGCYFYK